MGGSCVFTWFRALTKATKNNFSFVYIGDDHKPLSALTMLKVSEDINIVLNDSVKQIFFICYIADSCQNQHNTRPNSFVRHHFIIAMNTMHTVEVDT